MQEVDMEALNKLLGDTTAIRHFDKRQRLELELRVIEFWDANYYTDTNLTTTEICAFNARQVRKKKILAEIGPRQGMSKFRLR